MPLYKYELSFSTTVCRRCRSRRVRGVACPDCSQRPERGEVDVDLQRRQRVVAELLANPLPVESVTLDSPLALPQAVAPLLPEFLAGLQDATASNFISTERLRTAVGNGFALASCARSAPRVRPFTKPYDMGQLVVNGLESLIGDFLAAFAAKTPLEAQQHAAVGQRKLDDLAGAADDLTNWLERHLAVSEADGVAEVIRAVLLDASNQAGVSNLMRLAEKHAKLLGNVLGGPIDPSVAITHSMHTTIADLYLDRLDYDEKLALASAVLDVSNPALGELLSNPLFRGDIERLTIEIFDASVQCQQTIAAATSPRQSARAVVALNKTLVEAAGRVLAAPLLTAVGVKSKPYEKLRHDDAGPLVDATRDNPRIGRLAYGLDAHLRNAESHSAIRYDVGRLTTDLRSGARTYEYEALASTTFEAVESCLAVLLAVQHALTLVGFEPRNEAGLDLLGLSAQEIVDLLMPMLGADLSSALLSERELVLISPTATPRGISVALAGTIASLPPDTLDRIVLELPGAGRWKIAIGAIPPVQFEDEFEQQVAQLRMQRAWRNEEGEPWLSDAAARKWLSVNAEACLALESREQFIRIKALRKLAEEFGDQDCRRALSGLAGILRAQLEGRRPDLEFADSIRNIQKWAATPLDFKLI